MGGRHTPRKAACADLPQIDLVIRNVVIVSALGDTQTIHLPSTRGASGKYSSDKQPPG